MCVFLLGCCLPGVWDKVLGPVSERRNESGTLKLFPVYLKGEDLFGLTISAVTKIAESVCTCFWFFFQVIRQNVNVLHLDSEVVVKM